MKKLLFLLFAFAFLSGFALAASEPPSISNCVITSTKVGGSVIVNKGDAISFSVAAKGTKTLFHADTLRVTVSIYGDNQGKANAAPNAKLISVVYDSYHKVGKNGVVSASGRSQTLNLSPGKYRVHCKVANEEKQVAYAAGGRFTAVAAQELVAKQTVPKPNASSTGKPSTAALPVKIKWIHANEDSIKVVQFSDQALVVSIQIAVDLNALKEVQKSQVSVEAARRLELNDIVGGITFFNENGAEVKTLFEAFSFDAKGNGKAVFELGQGELPKGVFKIQSSVFNRATGEFYATRTAYQKYAGDFSKGTVEVVEKKMSESTQPEIAELGALKDKALESNKPEDQAAFAEAYKNYLNDKIAKNPYGAKAKETARKSVDDVVKATMEMFPGISTRSQLESKVLNLNSEKDSSLGRKFFWFGGWDKTVDPSVSGKLRDGFELLLACYDAGMDLTEICSKPESCAESKAVESVELNKKYRVSRIEAACQDFETKILLVDESKDAFATEATKASLYFAEAEKLRETAEKADKMPFYYSPWFQIPVLAATSGTGSSFLLVNDKYFQTANWQNAYFAFSRVEELFGSSNDAQARKIAKDAGSIAYEIEQNRLRSDGLNQCSKGVWTCLRTMGSRENLAILGGFMVGKGAVKFMAKRFPYAGALYSGIEVLVMVYFLKQMPALIQEIQNRP
ncbi:MAG: hypothetical protein V1717_04310, partial [Candidatus Micrarchaeota archaeon]